MAPCCNRRRCKLYKQSYDDTLQLNALLKPWVESQATWNLAQTGSCLERRRRRRGGIGLRQHARRRCSRPSFNPGWVAFDVTARVQQWANNASAQLWLAVEPDDGGRSTEDVLLQRIPTDPTLRPKLTVVYSGGSPECSADSDAADAGERRHDTARRQLHPDRECERRDGTVSQGRVLRRGGEDRPGDRLALHLRLDAECRRQLRAHRRRHRQRRVDGDLESPPRSP